MEYCNDVEVQITSMRPYDTIEKVWRYVHSFRQNISIGRQSYGRICHNNIAFCMHCIADVR